MKNLFKTHIAPIVGIIALVAVVGFSMAACAEDEDVGSEFNGVWASRTDATDIITISNSSWVRTKGTHTAGTLDFFSSPSYAPNIRYDGTKIGQAQLEDGVLYWYNTQNTTDFNSGNFVRR